MSLAPPWSSTTTSAHKISPPKENRKNLRRAFAGPKLASGATAMRARQHTHDVADRARYVSSSIREVFAVRINAVLYRYMLDYMDNLVNYRVQHLRSGGCLPGSEDSTPEGGLTVGETLVQTTGTHVPRHFLNDRLGRVRPD